MAAERYPGRGHARRISSTRAESAIASKTGGSSRRVDRLKDEVYREMLRLESNLPGAEMGLALALLRAIVQRDGLSEDAHFQQWLISVAHLGLAMIEDSLRTAAGCTEVQ